MTRLAKQYPFTATILAIIAVFVLLTVFTKNVGAQDDFFPPIRRFYYKADGVVCYEAATFRYYDRNPALALSCVQIATPPRTP